METLGEHDAACSALQPSSFSLHRSTIVLPDGHPHWDHSWFLVVKIRKRDGHAFVCFSNACLSEANKSPSHHDV